MRVGCILLLIMAHGAACAAPAGDALRTPSARLLDGAGKPGTRVEKIDKLTPIGSPVARAIERAAKPGLMEATLSGYTEVLVQCQPCASLP